VKVFTPSAQQSSLATNKMQFFPPTILSDKISATDLTKNIAGFHNRIKRHLGSLESPFFRLRHDHYSRNSWRKVLAPNQLLQRKVCLLIFETNLCCK